MAKLGNDHHQRQSCGRKKQYKTWTHAANDAKGINRRDPNALAEPYACRNCHLFHVGNAERRPRGNKKRHTTRTR